MAEGKQMKHVFWRALDFIIGAIFIYAGLVKVLDPVGFANDIDNYKTIPWVVGVRVAFYLPWLEIFAGIAVATHKFYRGGVLILFGLTTVFIVASVIAKARGIDITCGCFGHASKNWSFGWHLTLDFAIFAALALLLFKRRAAEF